MERARDRRRRPREKRPEWRAGEAREVGRPAVAAQDHERSVDPGIAEAVGDHLGRGLGAGQDRRVERRRHRPQLQAEQARGAFDLLPKQEAAGKVAELERLERTLGGMRDMTQLPAAVFIIDPKREQLAVHEARRLGIPVIAVTDTNCDPDNADFLIPANDDAIRAVRLLTAGIADAAIEGQTRYEIAQADREMANESRGRGHADFFAVAEDMTAAAFGVDSNESETPRN